MSEWKAELELKIEMIEEMSEIRNGSDAEDPMRELECDLNKEKERVEKMCAMVQRKIHAEQDAESDHEPTYKIVLKEDLPKNSKDPQLNRLAKKMSEWKAELELKIEMIEEMSEIRNGSDAE